MLPVVQDGWSEDEDRRLTALHRRYGSRWSQICHDISGRTAQQCRARWCQLEPERGGGGGGGRRDDSLSDVRVTHAHTDH